MSTDMTSIYTNNSNGSHSSSIYSGDQQQQDQVRSRRNSKLTAAELRKINKPIVEKKRRERINGSLDELKSLLIRFGSIASGESLAAAAAASSQPLDSQTKLEKADILELTVKRLKQLEESRLNGWSETNQYVAGYNACFADASEIIRSTSNAEALSKQVFLEQLQARQKQTTLQKSSSVPSMPLLTTRHNTDAVNKHLALQYTPQPDDPSNDQENRSAFTSLKPRKRRCGTAGEVDAAVAMRIPFSEKSTVNLGKQHPYGYPRHFAEISNTSMLANRPSFATTPSKSESSKENVSNGHIWRPF